MKPGYKITNNISSGDIFFLLIYEEDNNEIALIGYDHIEPTNVWKWLGGNIGLCIGRWNIKGAKSK